jgi:hypothetical protein
VSIWRRGWDSNPRWAFTHAGFQDRCLKPLGHPSRPATLVRHLGYTRAEIDRQAQIWPPQLALAGATSAASRGLAVVNTLLTHSCHHCGGKSRLGQSDRAMVETGMCVWN